MDTCQHCGQPVESEGFRPKKFCNDQCRYDFHNKKKKEKRELEKERDVRLKKSEYFCSKYKICKHFNLKEEYCNKQFDSRDFDYCINQREFLSIGLSIKQLAKHYQETGEYLPEAEALEEIHIMSIAEKIETKYNNLKVEFTSGLLELDDLIDIEIGHWQADNGFARPLKERLRIMKEKLEKS